MTPGVRAALLALGLGLLAWPASPADAAIDEADLLPVDAAFALRADAQAGAISVRWDIAEGYYLYRHRIGVAAGPGFDAGALQLPAGKRHTDEFFGEVETYRTSLVATLPGAATGAGDRVQLTIKYQGCADAGVCYPPQVRTVTVALPGGAPVATDTAGPLSALGRRLGLGGTRPGLARPGGASDAAPLPPEQAFGFEAIAGDGDTLLLRFTPAPGYYLYRDQTRLAVEQPGRGGARAITGLGAPRWPRGTAHSDEYFGETTVYFDQIDVPVPVRRATAGAATVTLVARFQGCQADGICYPPMTRRARVSLPAGTVSTSLATPAPAASEVVGAPPAAASSAPVPATPGATPPGSADDGAPDVAGPVPPRERATMPVTGMDGDDALAEDSRIARALAGSNRGWTLLGFFGAGLLLAFTPCVLPMIPILSGLIAGQGTRIGTRRALILSFVYVLANALVFTAAGVVAGLLGANLQVAFQAPWVIVAFALLFVLLALSSFGLYSMQLPVALRARLGSISDRQRGGSLYGVAAMGALSALIVGPCVAPPLAAAVLYIGQTRDPVLGGSALFLLAMGMGLPLLAFGAAAGRGMPTSGPWMTAAQRVFGFVFLGLAAWMLARILPAALSLALYGVLALAAAMWAFSSATAGDRPGLRLAARVVGLVLALVGTAELLGALGGGRDPLQPLAGVLGQRAPVAALEFRRIKSIADLDREIAAAQAQGKPLLFDFYADWCVACKEMEKYTFTDPRVRAALAGFVLVKADVTANDAADQALMRRHGVIGPPATLYFVGQRERRELRLFGFEEAAPFVARAGRAMAAMPTRAAADRAAAPEVAAQPSAGAP